MDVIGASPFVIAVGSKRQRTPSSLFGCAEGGSGRGPFWNDRTIGLVQHGD